MDKSNMPAFPPHADSTAEAYLGLTKREYFAALAMQGMLSANPQFIHGNIPLPVPETVAEFSAKYADALIKELN